MTFSKSHRPSDCKPGPFQASKPPGFDTSIGWAFRRAWGTCEKTQIPDLTLDNYDSVGTEQGLGIFILTVVRVIAMHRQVYWLSWLRHEELLFLQRLAEIILMGKQSIL